MEAAYVAGTNRDGISRLQDATIASLPCAY